MGNKPDVPIIVAKINFLGQNAPLGLTSLYTPVVDDIYRLTLIVQDHPAGAPGFTLFWGDSSGPISVGLVPDQVFSPSNAYTKVIASFFAVAGTPIQIQAGFSSNFFYNLYIVLEEL